MKLPLHSHADGGPYFVAVHDANDHVLFASIHSSIGVQIIESCNAYPRMKTALEEIAKLYYKILPDIDLYPRAKLIAERGLKGEDDDHKD